MAVETAERRARRRSNRGQQVEVRFSYTDAKGSRQFALGRLVDHNALGLGLLVEAALVLGQAVTLRPGAEAKQILGEVPLRAKVRFCRNTGAGGYRIGLIFDQPAVGTAPEPPPEPEEETGHTSVEAETEDLYEVLQVNPKADFDTIHRVYRLLALRYHPDNAETGDGEYFRKLTYAYTVLSDPAKRASHDVRREGTNSSRLRLFTRSTGASGAGAERRKRQGTLAALYQKRLQDPHVPTLSIFDLEELLGVAREHLEFTLWYLKERGLLVRADNNRFQITVAGVDEAERLESESMPQDRLLPAAGG
jgi:hypothetical protein